MILYSLSCGQDHEFEGWFRDAGGFDAQTKAGELSCPVCGDTRVNKAPMAPRVAASRALAPPKEFVAVREGLRRLRRAVEENCDHVGNEFAEEARKIHYGEVEKRNIYGGATDAEAKEMSEEGIEYGRIPWIDSCDN